MSKSYAKIQSISDPGGNARTVASADSEHVNGQIRARVVESKYFASQWDAVSCKIDECFNVFRNAS